jgi:metal-sulfur cluster biosynthetic enzyme
MEELTEEGILESLKCVIDPELGVNIVDLGLIYGVAIEGRNVEITITMTTRGCPMHTAICGGVEQTLNSNPDIHTVKVDLVWEPPWKPEMMSDMAKEQLGFF